MSSRRWSSWFDGVETEWLALPMSEREERAFAATGCVVAWPGWKHPVSCVHLSCRIRRGEKPPIALTNAMLRYEVHRNWLRFNLRSPEGRRRNAAICRALRKQARETGVYDIWKGGGWSLLVRGAVSA